MNLRYRRCLSVLGLGHLMSILRMGLGSFGILGILEVS